MNTSQKPQPLDRLAFLTKERVPGPEEGYQPIAEPAREPPLRTVVALGRQHLPVVLALLLGVALIGFHALTRSSATEVPAAPVRESSPASATASASASATPQPRQLRVHVLGAVVNPGVVRLPEGSIVEDAIEAAGGLRPDAAPGELNLAAVIQDGQQIIIGDGSAPRGEVVASTTAASDGGVVHLNSATTEQLESLPGVGPVLAADIVAWRDEHGPFTDVAQLQEVSGVGPRTYERLAPLVRV